MTDSLRIGKRAFAIAVAAATILWTVGISAFVAPLEAQAAAPGDLIRGYTLSTVYYLASDGNRYAFPNEKTFFTWHADFSGVQFISDSELAAIPLAGNIVYRPGSRWIKIQSDPKTYAVAPQGMIHWIESEGVAMGLAGDTWGTMIDDVPDVFFTDYTVGPSLTDASMAFDGAVTEQSGATYLVWDGNKRMIEGGAFAGNRYQDRNVLRGTGIDIGSIADGASLNTTEPALIDDAQLGGVMPVTGGLSVTLASDTAASATVPAGASSVAFMTFKVTATSGSADVDQIRVRLGGVGQTANIENVYLYDGATRLTKGRSINSQTREATFSALGLSLAAGESMYLTVRADIAGTTVVNPGDTARFEIPTAGHISSTATVSGPPVVGNLMSFSETEAGSIIVSEMGSLSDPTIGEKDAVIARFKVEADNEDAMIDSMSLNVDDANDHSNYKLWVGDSLVATGMVGGDDLVTFVFPNPYFIEEGDSENFKMSADIGGEAGDSITTAIEEEADVLARGGDFGFNLQTDISSYGDTGGSCPDGVGNCSYVEIQGGDLTFAFNGPPGDEVEIDGDDEVFMYFTITAENFAEINELQVKVDCVDSINGCAAGPEGLWNTVSTEHNLQNITIRRADGTTWMGPEELSVTGAETTDTLTFRDTQVLDPGTVLDLMITADVDNDAVVDDVFRFTILMGTVDAEDANGDTLTPGADIIPSSNIVGNQFTLAASTLDVNVSSPPSGGTYVKGSTNVPMLGITFEAGQTSAVRVTDLTLTADFDSNDNGNYDEAGDTTSAQDGILSCSIYDNESGDLIDGPKSVDADEELIFDSFSWSIPAGETRKMRANCNFANTAPINDPDGYILWIADVDDVTAEDEDGDDISSTGNFKTLGEDNDDASTAEIEIVSSGYLIVTVDGDTADSEIVLGNSTSVAAASYLFEAEDEPFRVETLTFLNCLDMAGSDECDTTGADIAVASLTLSFPDEFGDMKTRTSFFSNGLVTFNNLDFYVVPGEDPVLYAMVNTNVVDPDNAFTGDQYKLVLSGDEDEGGFADPVFFRAVGISSDNAIEEDSLTANASIPDQGEFAMCGGTPGIEVCEGNEMTIRKTKPLFSLPTQNASGAAGSLGEVFRFNVGADSRGYVNLTQVTFYVRSNSTATWNQCGDNLELASSWRVKEGNTTLDDDGDWDWFSDDAATCAGPDPIRYAVWDLAADDADTGNLFEKISAGTSKQYVLQVDSTGAVTDDTFQIEIPDEDSVDAAGAGNLLDAIQWQDDGESARPDLTDADDCGPDTGFGTCDIDEIDGDLVDELPLTGDSIRF